MPMASEKENRTVGQELARGRTEATPILALSTVIAAVAMLVVVALALVMLAYLFA